MLKGTFLVLKCTGLGHLSAQFFLSEMTILTLKCRGTECFLRLVQTCSTKHNWWVTLFHKSQNTISWKGTYLLHFMQPIKHASVVKGCFAKADCIWGKSVEWSKKLYQQSLSIGTTVDVAVPTRYTTCVDIAVYCGDYLKWFNFLIGLLSYVGTYEY